LDSQSGWCVWITGLPGSGKSSVAKALQQTLKRHGIKVQILSSDLMRKAITPEPTYSPEERDMVYAAIICVTNLSLNTRIMSLLMQQGIFADIGSKLEKKFHVSSKPI
jgi:adenylylsulfate kinase